MGSKITLFVLLTHFHDLLERKALASVFGGFISRQDLLHPILSKCLFYVTLRTSVDSSPSCRADMKYVI